MGPAAGAFGAFGGSQQLHPHWDPHRNNASRAHSFASRRRDRGGTDTEHDFWVGVTTVTLLHLLHIHCNITQPPIRQVTSEIINFRRYPSQLRMSDLPAFTSFSHNTFSRKRKPVHSAVVHMGLCGRSAGRSARPSAVREKSDGTQWVPITVRMERRAPIFNIRIIQGHW